MDLHAFFGVGAFIAPLIVAQVLSMTGDIYWVYWFFATRSFPLGLWIWNLPSPASRAVPAHHESTPFPILPGPDHGPVLRALCWRRGRLWRVDLHLRLQAELWNEVTAAYLTFGLLGIVHARPFVRDLGLNKSKTADHPSC